MICTRCETIGHKKLYRCLDCETDQFDNEIDDFTMCQDCKNEHIEANYDNETRFREIIE